MSASFRRLNLHTFLRTDGGAVALLVAIFFAANWPLLFDQVSEIWDGQEMFAPYYRYVANLARHGHLLWWNPLSNGGSPDFTEPQYGAFSPVTLLFGLLAGPGPTGYHLYWLCLWLFGGLGTYVLARALSAPPWGALVVSLGVTFGGFNLGHAEHTSAIYTYAFVPWVLWRVRVALVTGRWRPACEAGALWGLSALGGNPATHVPAGMFVGIVSVAWLPAACPGGSRWAAWRTYAVTMGLLLAVGVAVLAPAYLGFLYEVAGYSHRAHPLPREAVLGQGFGFSWLTALFTPVFVTYPSSQNGWDDFDISMRPLYMGAALPVLAAFAAWRKRLDWRCWWVLGTALVFLGIAMGSTLPLRAWMYDYLPLSRFFRHPPMFRGFFILGVAMLAASGTTILDGKFRSSDGKNLRSLALGTVVAAVLAIASHVWLEFVSDNEAVNHMFLLSSGRVFVAWIGLATLCVLAVQKARFRHFLPTALVALTAVDLVTAYVCTGHIAHQEGHSIGAVPARPSFTDLTVEGLGRRLEAQQNQNLYVRRPAFDCYTAMRNYHHEEWCKDPLLCRGVLDPRRMWFATGVPTVAASPDAFEAFRQRAHEIHAMPVIRHTRDGLLHPAAALSPTDRAAIAAAPSAQSVAYCVLSYHDNDLSLRVTCPADGFLLVTDRWARSWTATVNGQPTPIDGGDLIFRLLPVRAGESLVAMRYDLSWFYPLLILSWSTLAVVGTATLWKLRRPRRATVPVTSNHRPVLPEPAVA